MEKRKKLILLVAAAVLALALIIGIVVFAVTRPPKPAEIERLTVGDGKACRVGILSDSQLDQPGSEDLYEQHVVTALECMKDQGVDMLIFAGDFCDLATDEAYGKFNAAMQAVYGDETPIKLFIMGNHDYWYENNDSSTTPKQKTFVNHMGESPWSHKVVNGIHFIGASPSSASGYSEKTCEWIEEQIQIAIQESEPGAPVFVVTHHNPQDTAYGSDDWGDSALTELFNKYEQVVSISGHSHYSILDERSIYQKNFTAFTTQSLAYIELEGGKFDAYQGKESGIPPRGEERPMGLIMNVGQKQTVIERWNLLEKKEEKAASRWTLTYPMEKGNFQYLTDTRAISRPAPSFSKEAEISYDPAIPSYKGDGTSLPGISFPAAEHPDFVHSYSIQLTNTKDGKRYEYEVFSDFYLGLQTMADPVRIALDPTLPDGNYTVRVYARESFGKFSDNFLETQLDWTQPAQTKTAGSQ